MTAAAAGIFVVPANEASWEDLQTVFGTRGLACRCQCQRYKLRPKESFGSFPAEERADRLRQQTDAGHRESGTTSGLVAYRDGEPVGWCAVQPRTAYAGLLRNNRVPWLNRAQDRTDDNVWRSPASSLGQVTDAETSSPLLASPRSADRPSAVS